MIIKTGVVCEKDGGSETLCSLKKNIYKPPKNTLPVENLLKSSRFFFQRFYCNKHSAIFLFLFG